MALPAVAVPVASACRVTRDVRVRRQKKVKLKTVYCLVSDPLSCQHIKKVHKFYSQLYCKLILVTNDQNHEFQIRQKDKHKNIEKLHSSELHMQTTVVGLERMRYRNPETVLVLTDSFAAPAKKAV